MSAPVPHDVFVARVSLALVGLGMLIGAALVTYSTLLQ
jgi:hypothetical protein